MSWVHRYILIPAAQRATAKALVKTIADTQGPGSADGMFDSPLSATGTGAPTHYISCGLIQDSFAGILGNATLTHQAYQAAGGATITLAQVQALYAAATVRSDLAADGAAAAALTAAGLKPIAGTP